MTFEEYLKTQPIGRMKQIEREYGVGYTTLHRAKIGEPMRLYRVARKISDATGGLVSVTELCEPSEDWDLY